MRLRLPELLAEHGMTAYQLAQRLQGRVSRTTVYRMAAGEAVHLPLDVLEALCEVFDIKGKDVGVLFERDPKAPKGRR